LQVRGGSKLLLLNALHDPATGYLWALDAAGQLGRHAVLATYEGWGHGAYRRNDCTTQIVDRYLAAQVLPAVGTRCPATPPEPVTAERDAAANTRSRPDPGPTYPVGTGARSASRY
jgi:hypothetical protein